MGRPVSGKSSKTTLHIDPALKERAAIWAIKHHRSLSDMVNEGLRLVMAKGGR